MGAVLHCETFDGKLTADEVRQQYLSRRDEMEYEHGTDPYNGTWSTLDGFIQIHNQVLDSYKAADEFIDKNSDKRGCAHAVRFKDVRTETAKEPTFRGKKLNETLHNSVCVPENENYIPRAVTRVMLPQTWDSVVVAADQLKPAEQEKLVAAMQAWLASLSACGDNRKALGEILKRIENPRAEVAAADFAEVKKLRKQVEKTFAALSKAASKLYSLDKKHADNLYASRQVDHGTQWLVGGLCAE